MFAIALWDKTSQTLILARDRLGKKPLFYFWDGTQCIFGSELKALLQHPAITKEIDTQSLVQYFAFGYVPTPRSIFRHVFKVPPGSFISFCGRTKNEANFWELPGNEMLISEEDALEQLDQLLQDAVKIRLESDVPLGFL
jgi:asparagine synthase (glutamine-hydrolysing)